MKHLYTYLTDISIYKYRGNIFLYFPSLHLSKEGNTNIIYFLYLCECLFVASQQRQNFGLSLIIMATYSSLRPNKHSDLDYFAYFFEDGTKVFCEIKPQLKKNIVLAEKNLILAKIGHQIIVLEIQSFCIKWNFLSVGLTLGKDIHIYHYFSNNIHASGASP